MLGFKKIEQARSIAHGCASTLAQLYLEEKHFADNRAPWWQKPTHVDPDCVQENKAGSPPRLVPAKPDERGQCWFRTKGLCPFSPQALRGALKKSENIARADGHEQADEIPPAMFRDLASIYSECGKVKTHLRK
jgi:hypothetical protein